MNDPTNWNAKTGFPLSGVVVACHSGASHNREWDDRYGWLNVNELVLKSDADGRYLKITVREIKPHDAAGERSSEA